MERFDRNVGAMNAALQERPEVFQPVGMDFAVHVGHSMVNNFMLKFVKALVGLERVGEDRGTGQDVLPDFGLKRLLFAVWNYGRAHLAAALKNAHYGGLVLASSSGDFLRALR